MPTFEKSERLCGKLAIDTLFKKGATVKVGPLKSIYLPISEEKTFPVSLVIVVPKRNFKAAHDRNRIKRLVRESWRLRKDAFYEGLLLKRIRIHLAILFLGNRLPDKAEIDKRMDGLINQLSKNV